MREHRGTEKRVADLVEALLESMGYALVEVAFITHGRSSVLQLMVENLDLTPITLGGCQEISRAVATLFDVEEVVDQRYRLEVSSPGLNRLLCKSKDFERFTGSEIKVELYGSDDEQRKFNGVLQGMKENRVQLEVDGQVKEIDFDVIRKARLVPKIHMGQAKKETKKKKLKT